MGIVGAILGDIAGQPYEFQFDEYSLNLRRQKNYELYDKHNSYTDDTVMSIAVMEAAKNGGSPEEFAKQMRYWGRKHSGAGYDSHFGMWLFSDDMEAYGSYGNGSAMRVSYIGEAYSGKELIKMAQTSAAVSHNHPEGIKGAVVTARCAEMARNGASKEDILSYAAEMYPAGIYRYSAAKPTSEYLEWMKFDVSCQGSVPVAIRCFYETDSFTDCMYLINSMACDTDTLGAIAGGICEEYYGNCLGSKEADLGMVRRYLPDDLYEAVERK